MYFNYTIKTEKNHHIKCKQSRIKPNILEFYNRLNKLIVKENEFTLISPTVAHAVESPDNCKYFIAIFTPDYVKEFFNSSAGFNFYHFTVDNVIGQLFAEHMLHPQKRNRYMLKACAYALCAAGAEQNTAQRRKESDNSFVFNVNKYIAEHFQYDITRKEIASALNYEEHYFSNLFSKNMDMTLKKYINIYRFALAQTLLTSSKKNITQISSECGFRSIRSFNEVFKELSGMTPSAYREMKT